VNSLAVWSLLACSAGRNVGIAGKIHGLVGQWGLHLGSGSGARSVTSLCGVLIGWFPSGP